MNVAKDPNCLFCKFVSGEIPCHKVWESDTHLAFLTIFPNTEGFTVVASKQHYPSDALAQDDVVLTGLILAAKQVAKKINAAFDDVGRTGLFLEGFGVAHLHCKLFPMHGTKPLDLNTINSNGEIQKKYFTRYEGYMSSHNGEQMDDVQLADIAKKIQSA